MKKTILLLITLFCVTYFYAQQPQNEKNAPNPLSNEDFFNQAELVAECSFVKVVATCDSKGNRKLEDILALVEYKVKKVYKGDQSLTGSTVYIIENKWHLGSENSTWITSYIEYFPETNEIVKINIQPAVPRSPIISGIEVVTPWTPRIFFLTESEYPQTESSEKYTSNKKYKNLKGFEDVLFVERDIIAGLDSLVFKSHKEFYDYIRQFEGFTV